MNKSNTGKLLVSVMAMALVIAGAAVMLSDDVQGAVGNSYTLESEKTVTVYDSQEDYQAGNSSNVTSLGDAITNQEGGQVWVLSAGNFDVTAKTTGDWIGSKMVITESVTIIGAGQNQTVLYGWANGANAGSEYGQQDTIYVMGDDVTIRNLSVQPMAQLPSTTYSYNKAIEVYGNNVTIENVTIGLYNLGIPEGADIGQETYGGSIYFNSAGTKDLSATISGVTVNNGLITVSAATEGSDINITNTVINVTDDAGYGIYDSTSKSIEKITASGVTVNFNGTGAHFSDAINCAVPGVTVNVYKTQTTTGVTTIANGVTVNVYESITGDITNDGQVNILAEDATVNIIDGTGSTDTSGVSSEAKLSGELRTDSTFTDRQIVTVNDNLTLVSGTQLVIQGKLVIPEGITITIQDGAQLIIDGQAASVENDGSIIVQSSKQDVTDGKTGVQEYESTVGGLVIASGVFVNNGSIIGAYTDEDAETPVAVKVIEISADAVVKNNGSIEIGIESDIEILGTLEISTDATVDINGAIGGTGKIENSGVVTINGKTTSQFEITLVSADAIVNVESLTTTGVFIVTVDIKDTTSDPILGTAGIRLSAEGKNSIGGVVIVATTYTVTNDVYNAVQVSGEVTAANSTEPVGDNVVNPNTALTVFGYTIVSEDLKIGSYTGFNFGGKTAVANVIVSGNMQVSNVADIFTGSEVTVTGMLQTGTVDLEKKSGLAINAASYRVATTDAAGKSVYNYYYTTLENAIASEVKQINVLGKITVGSDISVPNGTTITQKNGKITVSEDATLTFVSGSKLVQSGQYDASEYEGVDVEGTLYFENASTGYSKNNVWIYSEVFSTDGTDALYTSLVNAMEAAESGTTIELYNKNVTIEKTSFTIKEGVTVDTKGKDFEVLGSTLTIDGTLYVNGGNYTVSDITKNNYTYKASVVLNGYIKSNVAMTYNVDNKAYPAGAYYSITTSGITTYYLTTVTNAATLINTVDGSKITISGENIIGDVEFTGTEDVQATIVLDVTAKVTAGTVMLSYATISFEGGDFVGTIANANGSFAFDDDVTFTATTVSADVNKDGNDVLAATGALLNGTVTADGTVNLGNSSNIDKLVVIGTVNIEGSSTIGILTVNGTVNILAGGAAGIDTAYVFGELTTAVATAESSGTGSATISKLYVGVMVQGTDEHIVDGNAGSISGNVTVSGTAYVSADSVVPESISNATGKYATGFYVEDALWLTAYGTSANVPNAPVTDAEFLGWYDPADEKQNRVDTNGTISSLATYDRLDAKINIYVYKVGVITDGTIGSVAIDGVILGNNGANGFVTTKLLAAGTHTLDYTLKSGYEGTATMTIDGQAVSGNDFTLSGDYGTPDDVDLTIYLSGPTPVSSGEIVINNGSDDMSLTDILLIVLVVLIVIMAIIVALRLMRS